MGRGRLIRIRAAPVHCPGVFNENPTRFVFERLNLSEPFCLFPCEAQFMERRHRFEV
jgi:hypothetical protein